MNYEQYLCLEQLLSAQRPHSDHPDELVFIVQHQTSELWFKLAIHELRLAIGHLAEDDPEPAMKRLARFSRIQQHLTEAWSVLETLTPTEYAGYRAVLGSGSGIQSTQYRELELLLSGKEPCLWAEFQLFLALRGHSASELLPALREIYLAPEIHRVEYRLCEQLVDIEENFQLWRFRHLKAVERVIGRKTGTAGTSGVAFLRSALDRTFFAELLDVRAEFG